MEPTQRSDKDKRLKYILSFATELESRIPAACSNPQDHLLGEIQDTISAFPSPASLGQAWLSKCGEIDGHGTSLWNLCTRLRRGCDSEQSQAPHILFFARIFAFLLLDCAFVLRKSGSTDVLRLMKIGVKAGKNCIDGKEFGLALRVLEKVGGYEITLKSDQQISPDDGEARERLIAEYYVLRTALAWQQGQFDMAEHLFQKSLSSRQLFDPHTTESLADVLYEMGKDLLAQQQFSMAVKWLDRSYEVLGKQDLDRLSIDASELRVSIMECLIKSLLAHETTSASERAGNLIDLLETELGDKLVVLLLRLELLASKSSEIFDSHLYSDTLHRMTRTMVLSKANLKLVMYHIRKLNDEHPILACKSLDQLLCLRILKSDREEWIHKIIITRLYMAVGQKNSETAVKSLEAILSSTVTALGKPLSPTVTLAAHTLLWKRIEADYTQGQYGAAEMWCQLAMHQIFQNSGEINMARISRKLLLCALARQDFNGARDVFESMSAFAKNESMTRFLMYKIALRVEDFDFAAECLQIMGSSSTNDTMLLYACVLDAQQMGNRSQTLVALQLVLEKHSNEGVSKVNLPSLVRLTISLLCSTLGDPRKGLSLEDVETVERLCELFERGVGAIEKQKLSKSTSDSPWTTSEIDWFSRNSYNLVITNISTWNPRHLLRMVVCCIEYIDRYPPDISEEVSEDVSLRKMFCEFSATVALVTLARGEDVVELQLQHYLDLRRHVASFDLLLQEKLTKMEEGPIHDLLQKLSVLIELDFEASCRLKEWDALSKIILKADVCKNPRVYELMADCVLSSQAPPQVMISTLKKIINEAWQLESMDSKRLAKYMRCLFQIAISNNIDVAAQLLDQVQALAEEMSQTELPYPSEELEWIATRTFNHAVDLYCGDQDDACRNWAGKAFDIAHFCTDGGALERLLQSKWLGLKWDT